MKTTRGRLYPTITLLIASLKPYFKEEKLKDTNEKNRRSKS
ncbi:MAG: hypothetical protein QXO40_04475 [Candidatus Aenigmatarchaeota archaeon]